jgi:hypothetical protein
MTTVRHLLGWTRHSSYLLSGFLLTCLLIGYIWWPLVQDVLAYIDNRLPWYYYVDWLLLGIFAFMSLTIISRADLKVDGWIILVGLGGGLVIESWGTQTNLWFYYTAERPPLWIIPAWPIASLSIDRLTRLLDWLTRNRSQRSITPPCFPHPPASSVSLPVTILYWLTFAGFYLLMLLFVAPTLDKSFTLLSLLLCAGLIATPPDKRQALLVFTAGSALGYFLELWGTTRQCWTYYTFQTPPFFAVLAHGMAAVAFWRTGLILQTAWYKIKHPLSPIFSTAKESASITTTKAHSGKTNS